MQIRVAGVVQACGLAAGGEVMTVAGRGGRVAAEDAMTAWVSQQWARTAAWRPLLFLFDGVRQSGRPHRSD
jgi:hypothetical protein